MPASALARFPIRRDSLDSHAHLQVQISLNFFLLILRPVNNRISISVSNDLATDQRVRKQCESLQANGYTPVLVGRRLPGSLPVKRSYPTRRMKLLFNKGPMFYAELNVRLFFRLLFTRASLLYANDLDTLPANALVSVLRGLPLVYDSHEYFTEVPEIQHKPFTKHTWRCLERTFIRFADTVITVSPSIATLLRRTYGLDEVLVVRNLPDRKHVRQPYSKRDIGVEDNVFLLIAQGSGINMDRGMEEMVEAMRSLDRVVLMIIGGGDAIPRLKGMVDDHSLHHCVIFKPKMTYEELMRHTAAADLGLSFDKDTNVNYRYSLPNKLFDYILAGTPPLVSDLVEVRRVVTERNLGYVLPRHDSATMARTIEEIRNDPRALAEKRENCLKASDTLLWKFEFEPVLERIRALMTR